MSWLVGQCPPVTQDDNEHTLVGMKHFYSHLRFNATLYTGQSVVGCYFSSCGDVCVPFVSPVILTHLLFGKKHLNVTVIRSMNGNPFHF